jgi:hypothetical protein
VTGVAALSVSTTPCKRVVTSGMSSGTTVSIHATSAAESSRVATPGADPLVMMPSGGGAMPLNGPISCARTSGGPVTICPVTRDTENAPARLSTRW